MLRKIKKINKVADSGYWSGKLTESLTVHGQFLHP